jgi:hypothetical protein
MGALGGCAPRCFYPKRATPAKVAGPRGGDGIRSIAWLALAAALLASSPARAADGEGRFALKSVGTASCGSFVAARDKGGEGYALYGGYLGGYVSAYNQLVPQTFDLTPFHDADTLAHMMAQYCAKHPQENFGAALWRLVALLRPGRLQESSPEVRAESEGRHITVYAETLRRTQDRLRELGHYAGESHGRFDAATREALTAYQQRAQLPPTGLPDQATLFRLTYRGETASGSDEATR